MCIVMMDATSARSKSDCLRRTTKPGAGLRWRLLRVSAEVKEGAHKLCRAAAVRTTVRRCLRREKRRLQAAHVAAFLGDIGGKKQRKQAACEEKPAGACVHSHPAEACAHSHPAGAMAPENTTQYLMSNVYEDMLRDHSDSASQETNVDDKSLTDGGDFTSSDSAFERYLAFQQMDFEEMVSGLYW